jgi:hypothetical protein
MVRDGWNKAQHSPVDRNTKPNFSVNNKPLVGLNRWPPDMPEFRAATTAY